MAALNTSEIGSEVSRAIGINGLPDVWTTLIEARHFSIPTEDEDTRVADPSDAERELRGGEVFFPTPLFATNVSAQQETISLRHLTQGGTATTWAHEVPVPAGFTVELRIQGRRLQFVDFAETDGERLQAVASNASAIHIWMEAVEGEAATHAPDVAI